MIKIISIFIFLNLFSPSLLAAQDLHQTAEELYIYAYPLVLSGANVKQIKAPTNLVWIIGRTQTNGATDYPEVNQFQEQIRLIPLSELQNKQFAIQGTWTPPAIKIQ